MNQRSRQHWAVAHRDAKQWKRWITLVARSKRPLTPLARAKIEFTRFSSQQPDYDGLVISFKHVLDALTEIGIIENDAPGNVELTYVWKKVAPNEGKIGVRILEALP